MKDRHGEIENRKRERVAELGVGPISNVVSIRFPIAVPRTWMGLRPLIHIHPLKSLDKQTTRKADSSEKKKFHSTQQNRWEK